MPMVPRRPGTRRSMAMHRSNHHHAVSAVQAAMRSGAHRRRTGVSESTAPKWASSRHSVGLWNVIYAC